MVSIRLPTDPPDSFPVNDFAKDAGLRFGMFLAYNQRAYPKNKAVAIDLLEARQELATTLGFSTYADLATADQMIGTSQNVKALLKKVEAVTRVPADREYALLLAFAQTAAAWLGEDLSRRCPVLVRAVPSGNVSL